MRYSYLPTIICLILAFAMADTVLPTVRAQQITIINVTISPPGYVTPNDTIQLHANVTSTVDIRNVTLFYRIGPNGLNFSSASDYNRTLMSELYPFQGGQILGYEFPKQAINTTVYFFIEATNIIGQVAAWPNYPLAASEKYPMKIPIVKVPESYFAGLSITVNDLDLGPNRQLANITLFASVLIPNFPEQSWIQPTILTDGGYGMVPSLSLLEGGRFNYYGRVSGWAVLSNGHIEDFPFDTYDLWINITIPYHIMNLTESVQTVPIIFGTEALWNVWNIGSPTPAYLYPSMNHTSVIIHSTLARNGVTGFALTYPPLVLLYTGFGILGLVPLISKYHESKKLDVYLNAIILTSSAELSQAYFALGSFLQQNFFTYFFAVVLLFSLVLMTVSSITSGLRLDRRQWRGIPLEGYAAILMSVGIVILISYWSIPFSAKFLCWFAGSFGTIIIFAIDLLGSYRLRRWLWKIRQPRSFFPENPSSLWSN